MPPKLIQTTAKGHFEKQHKTCSEESLDMYKITLKGKEHGGGGGGGILTQIKLDFRREAHCFLYFALFISS